MNSGGWVYFLTAIFLQISVSHGVYKLVCDGETASVKCPGETLLVFDSASYGRTNSSVCTPHDVTEVCQSSCVVGALNKRCFGESNCLVEASTQLYGDPCHGVPKYLEFNYQCIDKESVTEGCKSKRRIAAPQLASGYITSPGYPNDYASHKGCLVNLRAQHDHAYDLEFLDLDVEPRPGPGCYDKLYVHDMIDGNTAYRTHAYCGTLCDIHTPESATIAQMRHLEVEFSSDGDKPAGGFLIKYTEVSAKPLHREL